MLWNKLGTIDPNTLKNAREQLHQAVQLVALVGRNFLPPDTGDAYANLEWSNQHHALAGHWVGETVQYRAALQFPAFSLLLLTRHDEVLAALPLDREKYRKAFIWLQYEFDKLGFDADKLSQQLPYEMPGYPTAQNDSFSVKDEKALEELTRYFTNADGVLQAVKHQTQRASEVRCWPHHFDMATLITLEAHEDAELTKSISIGFSPGDRSISQPYFFVNCWPYPEVEKSTLPGLPGGHWHTEGWIGTVLPAGEIIQADNPQRIVAKYIEASTRHLQSMMGYTFLYVSLTGNNQ